MFSNNSSQEIVNKINKAKNILVLTHQKPDGDAIGAVLGISNYLQSIKKTFVVLNKTKLSGQFDYLEKTDIIINDENVLKLNLFDLILVFDSSDLYYTGFANELKNLPYKTTLVNIDHHETNEYFGHLNYVCPLAASTTEILYKMFKENNIEISKHTANCFLTGIITDTSAFTNGATTFSSIKVAAELLEYGVRFPKLIAQVTKNKSVDILKFWGKILSSLERNSVYDIAVVVIKKEDYANLNLDNQVIDGLANFLNNLTGVRASLVLKEIEDNKIKGSFRTTREDLDVSKIAKLFGGGGHKKSAGFSINGQLQKQGNYWQIV